MSDDVAAAILRRVLTGPPAQCIGGHTHIWTWYWPPLEEPHPSTPCNCGGALWGDSASGRDIEEIEL